MNAIAAIACERKVELIGYCKGQNLGTLKDSSGKNGKWRASRILDLLYVLWSRYSLIDLCFLYWNHLHLKRFRPRIMAIPVTHRGSQDWRWHVTIIRQRANINVVQRGVTCAWAGRVAPQNDWEGRKKSSPGKSESGKLQTSCAYAHGRTCSYLVKQLTSTWSPRLRQLHSSLHSTTSTVVAVFRQRPISNCMPSTFPALESWLWWPHRSVRTWPCPRRNGSPQRHRTHWHIEGDLLRCHPWICLKQTRKKKKKRF